MKVDTLQLLGLLSWGRELTERAVKGDRDAIVEMVDWNRTAKLMVQEIECEMLNQTIRQPELAYAGDDE